MTLRLHHVAVLVHSLADAGKSIPEGLKQYEVETFASEGTMEQYVDLGQSQLPDLLLVEALSDGPYRAALNKRGAGLHHFGYATDSLESAVSYFSEHGLLLHPISLETVKQNVVWMCRPGIPFLIELSETTDLSDEAALPIEASLPNLEREIDWVPGIRLTASPNSEISLQIGSTRISLATQA